MTEKTILEDPRWTKLSKRRREKLLEEHRYHDVDYLGWWDFVYEDFKNQAASVGICVEEMSFSGFCCQGDGAWFQGHVEDWYLALRELGQLLKAHSYWPHEQWTFRSHISHRGYMTYSDDMPADENPYDEEDEPLQHTAFAVRNPDQDDVDDIAKEVRELFNDKARELYKALEAEHDWLTADEQVVERLLANMTDEELADPDEELKEEDEISFA